MSPLLSFRHVEKSYGSVRALKGLNLELRAGQVLGLLGPNGAGKSTLIRILMDIVRPDAGSVELFGKPLCRASLDRVSYLPEERGLYRKQSVMDVLVYLGTLKGQTRKLAKERAHSWLERVSLLQVANHPLEKLSKGMSQKVQLVATFMGDSELYVLDEPFSGLDPINLRQIRTIISEQRALGRATILSTHQMNEVEDLCDSVALLDRGEVLISDSLPNVLGAHHARAFRVTSPDDLSELCANDRLGPLTVRRAPDGRDWVLALVRPVPGHEILNWLVTSGLRIEGFVPESVTLEDVFVRAVEGRRS
ncbi:MAG: ATP-binding cassette domain-containing protein [Polyangiaceae bacterium]|nr:ATP-binding cassette domain-containing protein [Polyangiaceae bacterium]